MKECIYMPVCTSYLKASSADLASDCIWYITVHKGHVLYMCRYTLTHTVRTHVHTMYVHDTYGGIGNDRIFAK